jgi:hypothetical protein
MSPKGARAKPADRNNHNGHQGEEENRLDENGTPARLLDARIEKLWDEGYLRNSVRCYGPNLVQHRCRACGGEYLRDDRSWHLEEMAIRLVFVARANINHFGQ